MKSKSFLVLVLVSFFYANCFAQPSNDGCSGAINLGSLPTPGACVSGLQNGAATTVTGTTVGATADNPFIYQSGCQGSSANMNTPSIDVWYKFTATGTKLNINLTGFPNANVALWSGTCGNLNGYNCSIGNAGGTTTLVATQIQIGSVYYISIGGNTDTQTSTFSLSVDNDIDCNNCLRQSSVTATPMPVNGAYSPGQTVQFCYTITEWQIQNTNWLHGVQITMGSGWTGAITSTTVPAACQGSGTWVFKPTGIGTVNGVNWGPGFYFESSGNANNPADNFGDYCSGTGLNWTFCFTLTVNPNCAPGSDLGVDINTSGDGESGSWSSAGCSGDYPTTFNAIGTCCPPTMTSTATCINATTGTATATPIGSAGPYVYSWSPGGQTTQTAVGLAPGTYTVSLTDVNLCATTATVTVPSNPIPSAPATLPVTYCQNATPLALLATASAGCILNWYGTNATGGTASSTAPTPSTTTAGTTTYYVSQTSAAGCEGPRASIVVTVNPLPVITVNSPTICPTVTAILTAAGATTYSWNPGGSTSNPLSVAPASTTTYTVTGTTNGCTSTATATVTVQNALTVTVNSPTICEGTSAILTATGATTYSWDSGASTINPYTVTPTTTTSYNVVGTSNGCTGTATATVTVNPLPVAPVTSPVVYCLNDVASALTATTSVGCTLNWYGTNATGGTASSTPPTPNTTTAGTTTYYVSQTSTAGCEGPRASVVVTVNPLPIAPTTGPVTYCLNDAASALTAIASAGCTLNWYGTDATGGTASSSAPIPSTTTVGTTNYYVSQTTTSGCEGPRANIVVTINALPVITVNSPTICPNTSATLTASGGVSYIWNPGGSTSNPLSVSPASTTSYTVTGTDVNGCLSSEISTVTVLNNLVVTVNSPTICIGSTVLLQASGATTYSWDSGTSIGISTANPFSVNPVVTTTYTVTGTTNGCTGTAVATVTVNPLPVAPTTAPVIYCLNDVASALAATASAGCILNWYGMDATGGTASSLAPTPSTSVSGTTTYYVSQTNTTTGCEGPRASIDVIVNPLPMIPVVSPVEYCMDAIPVPLTATSDVDCILNWYGTNATGGTASSIAPTPITSSVGVTTYYVSQTNSTTGCEGSRTPIIVTINALPIAPVANPVAYCMNAIAVPLSATALSGNILNWYGTNATGGTASMVAPTPITTTPGTTTYYVSQTNSTTGCEGSRTPIIVTINALPAAPVVTPASYCLNESAIALIATASTGNSLNWYGTNATGGTASNIAPTPSTSVSGIITYYVSQYVISAGCEGPRSPLDVTINPLPIAPLGNSVSYCLNETPNSLSAMASTDCVLNWYGTNATGGTASSSAPTPSSTTVGTTTYYVSQTNTITGCEGPRTPIDVIINPLPFTPDVTPVVYCINDVAIPLTASTSLSTGSDAYTLNWYGTSATGGTASSIATTPNTSVAGTINYYVSQTNTTTGCEGPRIAIPVTVNALTLPVFASVNSVCQGSVAPVLPLTSINLFDGIWSPVVNTSIPGTTTYTFTPNPGQCASTTTMPVTINPLPVIVITDPLPVCAPDKVDITNPAVTNGSIGITSLTYWTDASGTIPLSSPWAVGQEGVYFIKSITDFGCTDLKAVNVVINPAPIADFTPSPITMTTLSTESTMINNSINAATYYWDFGDDSQNSTEVSPTHIFPDTKTESYLITLIATSSEGCVDTAYANVTINEELIFYVPNTFTPDGDDYNETFKPVFTTGYDPYNFTLLIFNRWGELIFESHDVNIGWKGTYGVGGDLVQVGTYTWKIDFKTSMNDERKLAVGHVNVLK